MKLPRIKSVKVGERPLTIEIGWSTRRSSIIDLATLVREAPALHPLLDPEVFATVRVARWGHAIAWGEVLDEDGEGPIDMGADQLWRLAGEQAGDIMSPEAFQSWRRRHGLSLTRAAAVLGLSRRMVVYYDNGTWPIPKTVMLATKGYEAERQAA